MSSEYYVKLYNGSKIEVEGMYKIAVDSNTDNESKSREPLLNNRD